MQVQLTQLSAPLASSADLARQKHPQLFVLQAATVVANQLVVKLIVELVQLAITAQAQLLSHPFFPFLAHKELTEQQQVQPHLLIVFNARLDVSALI